MPTNNTKQAFWIALGNFFSALVAIVGPMILARYWSKSEYGTYKQVMYVYNTMLIVFTIGLPKAYSYFIPRVSENERKNLVNKITKIFIVIGVIFSSCLFFCSEFFATILKNEQLDLAIRLFSPVPLFLLPTMGIDGIFASYKKSLFMTIYTILTRTITILFTSLPVIIWHGNYIDSLIGFDIAAFITFIIAIFMRNKPIKSKNNINTSITYKEIFSFSLPLFTAAIWGFLITSADQFFISRYYGNEVFAEFSNGFMELPFITMIIGAITTILLPELSGLINGQVSKDNVLAIWKSAILKSVKIIYPMACFCIFFPTLCMLCLYGQQYSNSGIYFMLKNILGLVVIIPFQPIILAFGKTKEYSKVHFLSAIFVIILELFVVLFFINPIYIAIVSVICQIQKFFLQMNIITKCMNSSIKNLLPFKNMLSIFIQCCISALLSSVITSIFNICNNWILISLNFVIYSLIYIILCRLFTNSYRPIFVDLLPQLRKSKLLKYIP